MWLRNFHSSKDALLSLRAISIFIAWKTFDNTFHFIFYMQGVVGGFLGSAWASYDAARGLKNRDSRSGSEIAHKVIALQKKGQIKWNLQKPQNMVNKKVAMLPHAPSPPFLLGGVAVLQVASWRVNLEKVWPCGWSTRRYTFNKTSNNWWLYYSYISLLGLSKGNAQVEIPASFFFRSVANRSQVLITHAQPFDSNACAMFWVVSTWHSVMSDDEKLSRCKISKDTVYNTLKTHTKYAHIVRGRATLKDAECFRNGSVREPYERSLYERTFMSEPFIEKHAISTELSNVNREKHRRKSHRVCRRDREPSRIPIRSLKRLRNKSKKVRKFVYARILSCIPKSSTLYC